VYRKQNKKISTMKMLSKLVAVALLTVGLVAPVFAGSLSAQTTGGVPYVNVFWTVPSGASGQQVAQAFVGQIINQGPLGYYQLNAPASVNVSGPVAAGSYNVILQLIPGYYPIPGNAFAYGPTQGYSVAVVTW
jgi:hypothetical protein